MLMFICQYCSKEFKKYGIKNHEKRCKLNPNHLKESSVWLESMKAKTGKNQYTKAKETGIPYTVSIETRNKLSKSSQGRKHSDKTKQRLSEIMKKRHVDGKAWNIGQSRWNNQPSYPEQFFMQVIENEFDNKNYIREFPIGIYSADFCWKDLKKIIEIDGEQHQRFSDYIERDKRKDEFVIEQGFEILRIEWKKMFADTKHYIKLAYDFIHE